jgi:hypothetical protein
MTTLNQTRRSVKPATTTATHWVNELQAMLRHLNYPPCNVSAALSWVAHRGRIDGCPAVDVEDWPACNAIVHQADVPPTDSHRACRYEPTAQDAAWWAAESAWRKSRRVDAYHDRRAATSRALDSYCLGIIPGHVAEEIARTRRGGCFID